MRSLKAAIAILLLGEAAVAVWQYTPIEPSTAPVFSFPPAAANFCKTPAMVLATEEYQADRGGECDLTAPDGETIKVFYFEWDKIKFGTLMVITGHTPEQCNVRVGFKLIGVGPKRNYRIDHGRLEFDSTHFEDPKGQPVYMFKVAWMQGINRMDLRETYSKMRRLESNFLRHIGAARVLQGAISGARDSDHAWQLFTTEVLDKLEWQ